MAGKTIYKATVYPSGEVSFETAEVTHESEKQVRYRRTAGGFEGTHGYEKRVNRSQRWDWQEYERSWSDTRAGAVQKAVDRERVAVEHWAQRVAEAREHEENQARRAEAIESTATAWFVANVDPDETLEDRYEAEAAGYE